MERNGSKPAEERPQTRFLPPSFNRSGWMALATKSLRLKRRANKALTTFAACCHEMVPFDHRTSGSTAISAAWNAIDMPFPVKGGIMLSASPTERTPGIAACLPSLNPATALTESSRTSAFLSLVDSSMFPPAPRVTGQQAGRRAFDRTIHLEKTANIRPAVLDTCQTDITIGARVHFKIGGSIHSTDVELETDPRSVRRPASGGPDGSLGPPGQ